MNVSKPHAFFWFDIINGQQPKSRMRMENPLEKQVLKTKTKEVLRLRSRKGAGSQFDFLRMYVPNSNREGLEMTKIFWLCWLLFQLYKRRQVAAKKPEQANAHKAPQKRPQISHIYKRHKTPKTSRTIQNDQKSMYFEGTGAKYFLFLLDSSPVHVCFTPNTSWLKNAEKACRLLADCG